MLASLQRRRNYRLYFGAYGPYAVLGLVGGALADRWDRRVTLLVTQVAMALCAADRHNASVTRGCTRDKLKSLDSRN